MLALIEQDVLWRMLSDSEQKIGCRWLLGHLMGTFCSQCGIQLNVKEYTINIRTSFEHKVRLLL